MENICSCYRHSLELDSHVLELQTINYLLRRVDLTIFLEMKDRVCHLCNKLSDEFHYLFECEKFTHDRRLLLSKKY